MNRAPSHWVICEDGTEYSDRFGRFLPEFSYTRTTCARELFATRILEGATGILLDLDFRRSAAGELIDENGLTSLNRTPAEAARLAREQGILMLRQLRLRGYTTPVLLFADLDSPERTQFLESQFGPLHVVASSDAIGELALRMATLARK
jgi:hypothetical protein